MNNAELAKQLRDIADQLDPAGSVGTLPIGFVPAPGFVRVRPTGSRAAGVFRDYPDYRTMTAAYGGPPRTLWDYATACSRITNPSTGKPFFPVGQSGYGLPQRPEGEDFAIGLDMKLHAEDYFDEAEWQRQDAMKARDANATFISSPRSGT
jgi:hypothetical protein